MQLTCKRACSPGYVFALWLPALLALTLSACGGGTSSTSSNGTSSGSTSSSSSASSASSTAPSILSIAPTTAVAAVTTTFTVTGKDLPLTSVASLAGGSCTRPVNPASTGFTVVCTPGPVGQGYVAVVISTNTAAAGGYWIGQADLTVTGGSTTDTGVPSVADVKPASARPGVATTFTVSGSNLPLTSVVSLAGGSCATTTNPTALSFQVICTPGAVGSVIATVSSNTVAAGGTLIGQASLTISEPVQSASLPLNDTGINANQCYAKGSDALVNCSSAAALALNTSQDGMIGRDLSDSDSSDGVLGMSYSLVGPTGDCLKDAVTGLIWQRGSTSSTVPNTRPEDAEARSVAAAANSIALCGYADWRVPSRWELESLLLFGQSNSAFAIDTTWFPLTKRARYISSTLMGSDPLRLDVYFGSESFDLGRPSAFEIRLVR